MLDYQGPLDEMAEGRPAAKRWAASKAAGLRGFNDRYWQILLQKSKIELLRKSRES
jgi:hypothetical protein